MPVTADPATLVRMAPESSDHEARITSLEARMNVMAIANATRDRDIARLDAKVTGIDTKVDLLAVKVDANREAINALSVQTAERFEQVDRRFDALEHKVDTGFAEMRAKFDQTAAGMERIVDLLTERGRGES
jgi:uncharacterized coiled-coil protein SlyX